jgi:hypothetical protein
MATGAAVGLMLGVGKVQALVISCWRVGLWAWHAGSVLQLRRRSCRWATVLVGWCCFRGTALLVRWACCQACVSTVRVGL